MSEFNDNLKQQPEAEEGVPVLKVICKMNGYYLYNDVKKGTPFTETIVIKNDHKGRLQGKITSDAEWLVPESENLTDKSEQTLYIHILTSRIPENTYDAQGTITIDTNGGPPYLITFRVILEDLEIAADKFKKTYVPLAAACAGFIGSLKGAPFPYVLMGAAFAGIIFYSITNFIVKASLKSGLNIFKLPSTLIQGAAASVAILAILFHPGGSPVIKQNVEQEKPDIAVSPEKPPAPAVTKPEQLQTLPEAEKTPVVADQVDRNQQSGQVDDILTKETIALSGSLTNVDPKTADAGAFWGFGFEAADDKAHYNFGCSHYDELHFRMGGKTVDWTAGTEAMRTHPGRVTLYFRSQDWDLMQMCARESPRCEVSACPLVIAVEPDTNAKNIPPQPPLADALKSPSVNVESGRALRKSTRIASKTARKKKWKPKASSFAPPSRDDL